MRAMERGVAAPSFVSTAKGRPQAAARSKGDDDGRDSDDPVTDGS
jgi:hypothetical protein